MTSRECCESAEASLNTARQLLMNPSPSAFEDCLQALSEVTRFLESMTHGNPQDWDPTVYFTFHRIRDGVRGLRAQIEHGSNLISGWMQLRHSEGYTRRGSPELAEQQTQRLLEA